MPLQSTAGITSESDLNLSTVSKETRQSSLEVFCPPLIMVTIASHASVVPSASYS